LLFFCFFAASCLVCAVLVIFSKNPVFAVLFLVLCFCNVSALLFLLCLEFVPVTFIIIYVGAIAVLFLFVLMMLNINISEISKVRSHIASIAAVVSLIFFIELLVLTHFEF
jgi:NADH-quinone oxidoreductase subunit J